MLLFTTAFFVGLSGAMAPGPVTVVLTQQALRRGFRAAPLITLGHASLELIMFSLLLFGLGNLLTGRFAALIGLVGGGMLLWMGQAMILNPPEESLGSKEGRGRADSSPILAGVLATVSNPYWFLWWGTVGVGYISISKEHGFLGLLSFFTGHVLSDLLWLSFLALALVSGKRFMTARMIRGLMRLLGLSLVVLAGYFIWSGIGLL